MDFPHGETVTRVRAPLVADRYSSDAVTPDWDNATSVSIDGCAVWSNDSVEPLFDARTAVDSDFTIAAPFGADITAEDRVLVRGLLCEVAGRPFDWRSPFTGWAPGLVVQAKIREG